MYSNYDFYNNNPYFYNSYRAPVDTQLVTNIQKAINGEFSAIACYEKLARMATKQSERKQILEIQKDEKRHLEEFQRIYSNLTGSQPTAKITEGCPNSYKPGLEFAFKDEQETVDFYHEIAYRAQDLFIKEAFLRAAADEQNHAVWFLFFIQKNKK
ncbi:ferritin-like domain-containing protein [Neobacillus sp. PS3-34]|uniref:ferritin-like domain-containing protein n=1 Tax=Neobacillus sp. PS3-34 TaxID=3070678 RepID=UPI0027DF37D0|nr:ferritin-like domain-containing protein [Neobacillus sp. PS3-34]WML48405.1 ferritin-like domain-containing protein [Neobacillus sp. PS3-34]